MLDEVLTVLREVRVSVSCCRVRYLHLRDELPCAYDEDIVNVAHHEESTAVDAC